MASIERGTGAPAPLDGVVDDNEHPGSKLVAHRALGLDNLNGPARTKRFDSAEYFADSTSSTAPERRSGSDGSVSTLEDDTDAGPVRALHGALSSDGDVAVEQRGGAEAAQRFIAARAVLGEAPGNARIQRFDSADYALGDYGLDAAARTHGPAADAHEGQRVLAQRAIQGVRTEEPGRFRRFDSADHVMSGQVTSGNELKEGPLAAATETGVDEIDIPTSASGQALVASRAVEEPGRLRRFDSADFYSTQMDTATTGASSGDSRSGSGAGGTPIPKRPRPEGPEDPNTSKDGAKALTKHALGRLGLM